MNTPSRIGCLILLCGAALACGGDKDRVFGPEWKKDGDYFKKKIEIEASHPVEPKDSTTTYKIDLDHNKLRAIESDDATYCYFNILLPKDRAFGVEVRKDSKGGVYLVKTMSNRVTYFDFDQDGLFDAYIDSREEDIRTMILVDGCFVRVKNSKEGFKYAPEDGGPSSRASFDGQTRYTFEKGKWK